MFLKYLLSCILNNRRLFNLNFFNSETTNEYVYHALKKNLMTKGTCPHYAMKAFDIKGKTGNKIRHMSL